MVRRWDNGWGKFRQKRERKNELPESDMKRAVRKVECFNDWTWRLESPYDFCESSLGK